MVQTEVKPLPRRLRRWILWIVALLLIAVLGCYGWSRLRAGANAVSITQLDVAIADPSPDKLLVGCYNIAHGRGGKLGASNRREDGKAGLLGHLKEIGQSIREAGLDIVVLNEVDFSASWSWRVNHARVIGEAAGIPHVLEQRSYDMSLLFYELRFGNAILSRYPVRDAEHIGHPAFKPHESFFLGHKRAGVCTVDTPLGELRVVAVHLEVRDEATRLASMEILGDLEARSPEVPHLILGDFNTKTPFAGSERLRASAVADPTFPSCAPDRRIDWIFGNPLVELAPAETFGGSLSDHLGVKATVLSIAATPQP